MFTKDDKNKTSVEYDKETLISLQRLFEKIVIKKNIQEEENFSTRYSSIDNPFTRLYLEKPSQEKEYALIAQFIETYQTLIRKSKEGNDIIQCGNRFYIVPKKKK